MLGFDRIERFIKMYGIERKLFDQICKLRDKYHLQGIKAEFEAEGSTFRDLVRLRRLTAKAGIGLFLKIGGPEAVRDIKDSLEIGVDGLIAPMVESSYGIIKFVQSYHKVYNQHKIHLSINVETQKAVESLDEILDYATGKVDNITLGRSDLSRSYFDEKIYPDSNFILDLIEDAGEKCKKRNMTLTVGGSISTKTIDVIRNKENLKKLIFKIETRKVILPTEMMLSSDSALKESLKFEEIYILSKKEFSDLFIKSEIARLTELQWRK
jgi:hypothetical protein